MNDNTQHGLPGVMTRAEAAAHLKKHTASIDRWIEQGKLKAVKIGRTKLVFVESVRKLLATGSDS